MAAERGTDRLQVRAVPSNPSVHGTRRRNLLTNRVHVSDCLLANREGVHAVAPLFGQRMVGVVAFRVGSERRERRHADGECRDCGKIRFRLAIRTSNGDLTENDMVCESR